MTDAKDLGQELKHAGSQVDQRKSQKGKKSRKIVLWHSSEGFFFNLLFIFEVVSCNPDLTPPPPIHYVSENDLENSYLPFSTS